MTRDEMIQRVERALTEYFSNPLEPTPTNMAAWVVDAILLDRFSEVEPRECANETCSNTFVVQGGVPRKNAHAKGVMYCTAECARAQAQRAYRRRKADADPTKTKKRLSAGDRAAIRERMERIETAKLIADEFGVSLSTIRRISGAS